MTYFPYLWITFEDWLSTFLRAASLSGAGLEDVRVRRVTKNILRARNEVILVKYFTSFVYSSYVRFTWKKKLITSEWIE